MALKPENRLFSLITTKFPHGISTICRENLVRSLRTDTYGNKTVTGTVLSIEEDTVIRLLRI